jgi:hypothetical protein
MLTGLAGPEASQRTIEYPWVLSQVKGIQRDSLILDCGCSESLLSCILISHDFAVVGLSTREPI